MVAQNFPISEDTAAVLQQFAVFPIGGRYYQGIILTDAVTGVPLLVEADGSINANVTGSFAPAKGAKTLYQKAPAGAALSLLPANANRIVALIQNVGAQDVWLGPTNAVTTGTGFLLSVGATYADGDSSDAWFGITAGAAGALRIIEVA